MDILDILLLCLHQNQTTPRRDEQGEYRRCLECGGRIPWSWADDFPIRAPKPSQPSEAPSFSRAAMAGWKLERKSA